MKQFVKDKITLLQCDCMDYMKDVPDKYFDLAIVDPPYGINAGNMTMGKGSGNDLGKHKANDWDKNIPSADYFSELFRISKKQIIWGGNYFGDFLGKYKGGIIWDKEDYNSDFADCELAWSSCDKVFKIYKRARSKGGDSINKIHPTQKPIALYKWLLKNYATPDMKIIDTHGGSMSSMIACYDFGCEAVCCEIDEDYFDAGVKRFDNETRQLTCFKTHE